MNWRDNPWFPPVLNQERLDCFRTNKEDYDTIWEGKCRLAVKGAIYADEIAEAIMQDTINFFSLVVRMVLSYRPLRIFIPMISALGVVSLTKAVYDINAYDWHFATSTVILITLTFQIIVLGLIADLVVSLHKT